MRLPYLWCRLFGHDWLFPRPSTAYPYGGATLVRDCKRCGARQRQTVIGAWKMDER